MKQEQSMLTNYKFVLASSRLPSSEFLINPSCWDNFIRKPWE